MTEPIEPPNQPLPEAEEIEDVPAILAAASAARRRHDQAPAERAETSTGGKRRRKRAAADAADADAAVAPPAPDERVLTEAEEIEVLQSACDDLWERAELIRQAEFCEDTADRIARHSTSRSATFAAAFRLKAQRLYAVAGRPVRMPWEEPLTPAPPPEPAPPGRRARRQPRRAVADVHSTTPAQQPERPA